MEKPSCRLGNNDITHIKRTFSALARMISEENRDEKRRWDSITSGEKEKYKRDLKETAALKYTVPYVFQYLNDKVTPIPMHSYVEQTGVKNGIDTYICEVANSMHESKALPEDVWEESQKMGRFDMFGERDANADVNAYMRYFRYAIIRVHNAPVLRRAGL